MPSLSVVKFGGTSVANAERIKKACDIVLARQERKIMVVSAPGKRNKDDRKITDLFKDLMLDAKEKVGRAENAEGAIISRFYEIEKELEINDDESIKRIKKIIDERRNLAEGSASIEPLWALGEELNARIITKYLKKKTGASACFLDAKDIFNVSETAFGKAYVPTSEYNKISSGVSHALSCHDIVVVPGFYASGNSGSIRTFARGGSDYTAAVLAAACSASIHENFTDVNGIRVADPSIVDNPSKIDVMSLRELGELTLGGSFGVFQDDAIAPLARAGIPIHLQNTFEPGAPGTKIVPQIPPKKAAERNPVTGIAYRGDFTRFDILKYGMGDEVGTLAKVIRVFSKNGISVEHTPDSRIGISVIVKSEQLKGKKLEIAREIKNVISADEVEIRASIGLVSVVGEGIGQMPGLGQRIFGAVGNAGINIANSLFNGINMTLGIENGGAKETVRAVYKEFFERS